jgi:hypothetical protein
LDNHGAIEFRGAPQNLGLSGRSVTAVDAGDFVRAVEDAI